MPTVIMAVGISNIMLLLFPSHVIPIYFRTKLDEGPFHSEQKAEVHRVWFGGSTEDKPKHIIKILCFL